MWPLRKESPHSALLRGCGRSMCVIYEFRHWGVVRIARFRIRTPAAPLSSYFRIPTYFLGRGGPTFLVIFPMLGTFRKTRLNSANGETSRITKSTQSRPTIYISLQFRRWDRPCSLAMQSREVSLLEKAIGQLRHYLIM